jgi:hypothetical protein
MARSEGEGEGEGRGEGMGEERWAADLHGERGGEALLRGREEVARRVRHQRRDPRTCMSRPAVGRRAPLGRRGWRRGGTEAAVVGLVLSQGFLWLPAENNAAVRKQHK